MSIRDLIARKLGSGITLEPCRKLEHGDFATSDALAMAKERRQAPMLMAQELADTARDDGELRQLAEAAVAPPGFVNFRLLPEGHAAILDELLSQPLTATPKTRHSILLEYVSANPTGDLHMGHGRGAVVGSALAGILTAVGHEVWQEFLINDAGEQIGKLAASAWAVYRGQPLSEGDYPADLLAPYVRQLPESLDKEEVGEQVKSLILNEQKRVLDYIGVGFDTWVSEKRDLHDSGRLKESLEALAERGLSYDSDGALWLASRQLGDERDRVLLKSEGRRPTYLAADIAYHTHKLERRQQAITLWGADHQGQELSMLAALRALGYDSDRLTFLFLQFVSLVEGGQELKMSKRSGRVVTVREVAERVGRDAFRLLLLLSHVNNRLAFDLDLALRSDDQNPVFYVQYAHARACSMLRHAPPDLQASPNPLAFDPRLLSPEALTATRSLMVALDSFSAELERAARDLNPSSFVHYLIGLATKFHSFYTYCRVLDPENHQLSASRLAIVRAFRRVLSAGLHILGITAPEQM
jgi:arginyl-tRNA synthetase